MNSIKTEFLLWIPKFSYVGASVGTVIKEEFILVGSIFMFAYKFGYAIQDKKVVKSISKVAITSLLMGVFIRYFKSLIVDRNNSKQEIIK